MNNLYQPPRKGQMMKTRSFTTLFIAASVVITAVAVSLAQESEPELATTQANRPAERDLADALVLQNAAQLQSAQAPTFTNQVPVPTAIYNGPFPGFNSEFAKANNAANQNILELVKKIKETADEDQKLELKAEVKQLLDDQYDAYLAHHETPLKKLEERLEKLRAEFESRKKAKDDLVKLRLDTIWYDAIGLSWPDHRGSSVWRSNVRPMISPAQVPRATGTAFPQNATPPDLPTPSAAPRLPGVAR